jgi:hypothetical protein
MVDPAWAECDGDFPKNLPFCCLAIFTKVDTPTGQISFLFIPAFPVRLMFSDHLAPKIT